MYFDVGPLVSEFFPQYEFYIEGCVVALQCLQTGGEKYLCDDEALVEKVFLDCINNFRIDHRDAFEHATENGYYEVAKELVKEGTDINTNDGIFLREAIKEQDLELVKWCVEMGADVNGLHYTEDDHSITFHRKPCNMFMRLSSHWIDCISSISFSFLKFEITCDFDSIFDSFSYKNVLSRIYNSLIFTLDKIKSSNCLINFQCSQVLL